LAYQANYCCRFPELVGDAKHQLSVVLRDLQNLSLREAFDVLMVNAATFLFLDDEESALESAREAVTIAQTLDDSNEIVKALNTLGMILYRRCDWEFEAISEQLRQMVVTLGAWRFSQASHWIPAEYYARCGNSQRSLEAARSLSEVILGDDTMRRWEQYYRRIAAILINLIDEKYREVLADFARLGLPEHLGGQYDVLLASTLSHAFLGDEVRATHHLSEARAFREKMANLLQKPDVFDGCFGEVIALCSIGRWTQAKRLMSQQGAASASTPGLYNSLMLLCDGPPFVGVALALEPFLGKPYVGMLALLATRVVEKSSMFRNARQLSAAEADILRLLGLGKSNKEIASTRSRSIETVKRQVASLFRKLGVENRTSAVALGRERGLL
jgi:DNA-binding CsgD family transcriptional regulator